MNIRIKKAKSTLLKKPLKTNEDTNIKSDVNGSYTGSPTQEFGEVPVQDADDL